MQSSQWSFSNHVNVYWPVCVLKERRAVMFRHPVLWAPVPQKNPEPSKQNQTHYLSTHIIIYTHRSENNITTCAFIYWSHHFTSESHVSVSSGVCNPCVYGKPKFCSETLSKRIKRLQEWSVEQSDSDLTLNTNLHRTLIWQHKKIIWRNTNTQKNIRIQIDMWWRSWSFNMNFLTWGI